MKKGLRSTRPGGLFLRKKRCPSVDRQRLAEVPGEIRVRAPPDAHLVGQELQRYRGQDWREQRARGRDGDQFGHVGGQPGILLRNGNGQCAPTCGLVDAADHDGHVVRPRHEDHREAFVHGRQRPVLEFRGEHAFAMRVGDLFDLQSTLEGDGVGQAEAEAIEVGPVRERARQSIGAGAYRYKRSLY